ncbi:GNAT family N-acetyltransferase [Cereibacter changlensis JA139]|uniref:GNAT family N-acetyltransferase n=1 Tax=Cereibacter changlensis JA139 TaxID=1188249 RepID=A0A2T4JHF3_9RHOB|nr:GNAT family N-acetyltransferase [Cereibacter changlensis]PTE17339.1 GNAT family N-acetyltransferase [Cereibacter changlensis JA139]
MSIQIRAAETTDVAGIFHVRTSVKENVLSAAELKSMGITEDSITAMIENGPCAWVAVEDSEVIGFSMIDAEEGSLFAAFVLPSHEGRGVGRRIVEAAERELFTRHAVCWLETGSTTRAAQFYRRLGWSNEQDIGNGDIRLEKRRA